MAGYTVISYSNDDDYNGSDEQMVFPDTPDNNESVSSAESASYSGRRSHRKRAAPPLRFRGNRSDAGWKEEEDGDEEVAGEDDEAEEEEEEEAEEEEAEEEEAEEEETEVRVKREKLEDNSYGDQDWSINDSYSETQQTYSGSDTGDSASQRKTKKGKESNNEMVNSKQVWSPEREQYLCEMWEEEECLYIVDHPLYRCATTRAKAMRRFAKNLGISDPEVIIKHLRSMRTVYTKAFQDQKPGTRFKPFTKRAKRIMRLCSFLKNHILRKRGGRARFPAGSIVPSEEWERPTKPIVSDDNGEEDGTVWPDDESTKDSQFGDLITQVKVEGTDELCLEVDEPEDNGELQALQTELSKASKAQKSTANEKTRRRKTKNSSKLNSSSSYEPKPNNIDARVKEMLDAELNDNNGSPRDVEDMWSVVLAGTIKDMPRENRQRFRLAVDTMALAAMTPGWKP